MIYKCQREYVPENQVNDKELKMVEKMSEV